MVRTAVFLILAVLSFVLFGGAGYQASYSPTSDLQIAVSMSQMHPYLAEYERELRVRRGGNESKLPLFGDSGGYALVNVYRNEASGFILRTMGNDEYAIDEASGEIRERRYQYRCHDEGPKGAHFVGAFDFDESHEWKFIPAHERQERPILWSCNVPPNKRVQPTAASGSG